MVEIRPVSTARAKRGAWAFVLCHALLFLVLTPAATDASDPSWLKISVQRLDDRLAELIDRDRLLDTLHFGWFDQPYKRATLAVAVRSVERIEGEVAARGAGRQTLSDAQVQSMIAWTTDALDGVTGTRVDDGFRPHRIRVAESDLLDPASSLPPLFGFIDAAPPVSSSDPLDDLDWLAALGTRVLGRPTVEPVAVERRIAERAYALGMAIAYRLSPSEHDVPPSSKQTAAWRPMTLRALLEATPTPENQAGRPAALADPFGGESWASSAARRALMRGVTGRQRYTVCPWFRPHLNPISGEEPAQVRAAMWMHAVEGQALALLEGWSRPPSTEEGDRADGRLFLDPAELEAVAHGALDLLRMGDRLNGFASRPYLAMAIDNDAVDPLDDNRWAGWIEPIWEGLLDSQVRFDVIPVRLAEEASARGYGKIYRLRKVVSTDPKFALLRLKHKLALLPEHVNRLTARTALGLIAERVWIRDGLTKDGRACVAVANLSDKPRMLRLRGEPRLGPVRDLRTGNTIESPAAGVAFAPWQLRVLWPMDN